MTALGPNSGQTHHQMGELNEAMSLYQEFLTVAKARLGSEHRDVVIMYKCTAQIHQERNEFDIAKQMFEKGIDDWTCCARKFPS